MSPPCFPPTVCDQVPPLPRNRLPAVRFAGRVVLRGHSDFCRPSRRLVAVAGREALSRIKNEGLARKLCTITLAAEMPEDSDLYGGEAVYAGGRVVGRLRSAGWGYTVTKHIGFVYLPAALSATGIPLEVEAFGARFAAEVAPDVLYDPAGARLRL